MVKAGLWVPCKQRASTIQQPRYRRACCGELIQIDGCDHHWFENRAPACTTLVYTLWYTSHQDAMSRTQKGFASIRAVVFPCRGHNSEPSDKWWCGQHSRRIRPASPADHDSWCHICSTNGVSLKMPAFRYVHELRGNWWKWMQSLSMWQSLQ